MSRYLCPWPVWVLVSALAATSAFAAPSAPPTAEGTSQKATTPAATKPADTRCLRHTGSLIRVKPGQCLPVAGRSYSGDELRRTGTQNTARGLQMLDPSISVGH